MFAAERQERIYEMIQEKGAVNILSLVDAFRVSAETIRRDLLTMEEMGRLVRVHGGAVARREMKPFNDLQARNKEFSRQKQELAAKAAEFVADGDIIAIDSGSTAIAFAEAVRMKNMPLTVVTHSMDVFRLLSRQNGIKTLLCGGYYMEKENSFYGEMALEMLRHLHVQKAFLCPSGISYAEGICDYQGDLLQIQKQLIQSADEVFILADSSKFEKKAFLKLSDMSLQYRYVTDSNLSEELRMLYREKGFRVEIGGNKG